ncbi:MAG: TonB-dependent receptor [Acidobacteriota bacterium]|nr:TonB-dependent receptor [Acidobacteriota bacterium]
MTQSLEKANRLTRIALLAFACLTPGLAQENYGSINGQVTDASGASIPSAQIAAVSDRLPRGVQAKTDSGGNYALVNLPIGIYTVTISAPGFVTFKAEQVEVKLGAPTSVSPRLSIGQTTDTVEISSTAVALDVTDSSTSTTISSRTFDNLARGRTFNSILAIAPGVRQEVKGGATGVGGFQVDGSSGLENTYYLDGVEASDVLSGALRSANAVPLEFVQQVDIKTGGFDAQYGGATGGVINVAINSGANAFHGQVYAQYTGANLNAGDRGYWQRSPLNADAADFYRPKEDAYTLWYPGGVLGGRIIRDKLFFFMGYSPELEHTDRSIAYASGARLFTQDRLRHYGTGRLDYTATSKLQLYGSWIWSPQRRSGSLPNRDVRIAAPTNNQSILGGYTPNQLVNTGATYSLTPRITLSARYGYKYLNDKDGNYGIPGDPYVVYNTASTAAGLPVPTPGGNGFSNVSSTLTTFKDVTTRNNLYIDSSYLVTLFGQQHNFKAGYSLNRLSNDVVTDYSNGLFNIFWGQSYSRGSIANQTGTYGYYTWEDGVRLNSKVNGRNQGVYIQDSWKIHRRVSLNIGVRLENEFLPPYKAEQNGVKIANPVSFGWGSKVAPRLGVAWDILGDGKWKLSSSLGYFYDVLKYNLARGSFGGEYWVTHVYTLDNPNVLTLSKANPGVLGKPVIAYDNRTIPINAQGALDGIDPNLKPYESRDFNISFDHQLASRLVATVRYTRKDLLRTIEDIGVLDSQDNEVYLIGNPGFGQTRNDPTHTYDGKTPNGKEYLVPKAVRQYDGVEFRVQGQIGRFSLIPSYTWSRLYGNYSGLGNSDESGRASPNNNRSFDLPYYYFDASGSQKNVLGLLGTDRPHTFKFFGSYDLNTKLGSTNIGVNQIAYSGTNDTTTVIYLSAPTTPYGRGDIQRTGPLTQTDLLVSHSFKVSERLTVRGEADIRNLFNQAAVLSRVSQLNRTGAISQAALPLSQFFAGYDPRKFVTVGSKTVPYNPIYGLPGASYRAGGAPAIAGVVGSGSSAFAATFPGFGAYQDFRTIRLGIRLQF